MAIYSPPQYGFGSLVKLGNQFAKARTGKALDLETGRRNPWDLPEWKPMVEGYQTQYSRGLGDLARTMNRTGVSGPAAGLTTERAGDSYAGNLLQLPQQIRQSYAGEGWKGATMGEGRREFDTSQALQKYTTEGGWDIDRERMALQKYLAEKQMKGGNFWDKYGSQILGGAGGLASMFGGPGGLMSLFKMFGGSGGYGSAFQGSEIERPYQ